MCIILDIIYFINLFNFTSSLKTIESDSLTYNMKLHYKISVFTKKNVSHLLVSHMFSVYFLESQAY